MDKDAPSDTQAATADPATTVNPSDAQLAEALKSLIAANASIGIKKALAAVREQHPEWADGIDSKRVRQVLATLKPEPKPEPEPEPEPAARGAPRTAHTHTSSAEQRRPQPLAKPFTALQAGTFLHRTARLDVYKLLMDCYRLRMHDDRNFDDRIDPDGMYGGAPDFVPGFRRFLTRARAVPQLLPASVTDHPGWEDECVAFGMAGPAGAWYSLRRGVDKPAVNQHYQNAEMPLQLRLLGGFVYGRGVGGQSGAHMLKMMALRESGDLPGRVSNFISLNSG